LPDPLFFEETWTLGVPTAVENWKQRQYRQAGYDPQCRAYPVRDGLGSLSFVQDRAWYAEHLAPVHATTIAGRHDADWPLHFAEGPATPTGTRTSQEWKTFMGNCDNTLDKTHSITRDHARRLLGVTATSTREQIKAAYRRMASQWHPDRLECKTEEARRLATERMTAINEAYRMLRLGLQQGPA
jgi:hypothetical protein